MNKKLLSVLVAAALPVACNPAPAYPAEPVASLIYESNEVTVRLFRDACDTVKVTLPPQVLSAQRAAVVWQGKDYVACWSLLGAEVLIADETGDAGTLPTAVFKVEQAL